MIFKIILALSLFGLGSFAAGADTVDEAKKPVERLNGVLIEIMKDAKALGYQGRYKKLEPVVGESFDFDTVSRVALGAVHWKKLSDEQKSVFRQKLIELSIATYAERFNGYEGEKFKFQSPQDLSNGRLLLRYTFSQPKETPLNFDYLVTQNPGGWKIYDIRVDGISDLALRKAQYTSVMDREGFDGLLKTLTQKIAEAEKRAGASG